MQINVPLRSGPLTEYFLRTAAMVEPESRLAAGGEAAIEININRLSQLFNSFDPSPFHERDLDNDAEEYIVSSVEEASHRRPLALVIHLPADQLPEPGKPDLTDAIHHYFAYRLEIERRRLRLLFHNGRIALAIGLAFLFSCVLLRGLISSLGRGTLSDIVGEGMLIIGWVAMWRPLEILLYDWVPVRRRCRTFADLSQIPVDVRAK